MGILRDFERRLGGAVEGFFARAFRSGLQPVELAKALRRYMGDYQQVGLDGVFVPNAFHFQIAQADYDRFESFLDPLTAELAEVARRTAKEHRWHLQGPVEIELDPSPDIAVGTYELRGKVSGSSQSRPTVGAPTPAKPNPPATAEAGDESEDESQITSVLTPQSAARAHLEVLEGPGAGRHFTVAGATLLGRLSTCDISIDDPSVSRRHARIRRVDETWTVEDLGSTNGVAVNNRPVGHATLNDGDELLLGSVRLAFSMEA